MAIFQTLSKQSSHQFIFYWFFALCIQLHVCGTWSFFYYMSAEDQQKGRALFPQRKYYRRKEISGKQFTENPNFFLNNHCEINVLVESEAELENVIAIFNKLRYIAEAEKAYTTKLGIASMAQLNQLGVSANVTTDNSTTLNVTIRGKDGSEQTINEFIDIPNKN